MERGEKGTTPSLFLSLSLSLSLSLCARRSESIRYHSGEGERAGGKRRPSGGVNSDFKERPVERYLPSPAGAPTRSVIYKAIDDNQ